jgi:hypothetical protein
MGLASPETSPVWEELILEYDDGVNELPLMDGDTYDGTRALSR